MESDQNQRQVLEVQKLEAEIRLLQADHAKVELEKQEIETRSRQRWWNLRASGLIQAVIGGVVAGALIAGFMLDHFLKVSDLNTKAQQALVEEREALVDRTEQLQAKEEESRQTITSLRNENDKLKVEVTNAIKSLEALMAAQTDRGEDQAESLRNEIDALQSELVRVQAKAVTRERSLSQELQQLSLNVEQQVLGTGNNNWFAVIASPYNVTDLRAKLQQLASESFDYPIHVYSTTDGQGNPVYAVTFGGYLTKADASQRVRYARNNGVANDAYTWRSNNWGQNIADQFSTSAP